MQIYGHPGDRVDFVSKSASAGSILFGDPRSLVEEFFGPAHTEGAADGITELGWFSDSIIIVLRDGKVAAVRVRPQVSREKIDVFVGKERLNPLTADEAAAVVGDKPVRLSFGEGLELVEFAG